VLPVVCFVKPSEIINMGKTKDNDGIDEYPDLDYGNTDDEDYDTAMRKKVFFQPINTETTKVSRSVNFTCSPAIVHFSGFQTNEWCEQEIKVVNISRHSQRLSILLPTTDFFEVILILDNKHHSEVLFMNIALTTKY